VSRGLKLKLDALEKSGTKSRPSYTSGVDNWVWTDQRTRKNGFFRCLWSQSMVRGGGKGIADQNKEIRGSGTRRAVAKLVVAPTNAAAVLDSRGTN